MPDVWGGKTLLQRFTEKVVKVPGGCWTWIGAADSNGYGRFRGPKGLGISHRISYELHVGEIPEGHDLDHLCRNPSCVRPDHLQPVTRRLNMHRSPHTGTAEACKRGHPRTPESTYRHPNGSPVCRICERERNRRRYERR